MHLYNFLFYILLISFVRGWSVWPPVNRPRRLLIVQLSPTNNQRHISNGWKTAYHPAFKAPQVEIHVLKGHVSPDQNWMYSNEYKYSNQYYETAVKTKIPSMIDHKEVKKVESGHHVTEKNKETPGFGPKNIIDPPIYCQSGYELDGNNVCRERLERKR